MRSTLAITLVLATGCGLGSARARVQIDRARIEHASAIAAQTRAPVPFDRYQATLRAARASSDADGARGVLASEARMWLEVAIADSERIALAERRFAEEQELAVLDAEITRLERAQRALADENAARAAQEIARNEAKAALLRAAQKPAQRVKLSREEAQRAAVALRRQAALIALALKELEPPPPTLARLEAKLAQVDATLEKTPEASLVHADEALSLAQASLRGLREGPDAPSALEREALAEALSTSGARTSFGEHGRTATIDPAFRGAALTADASRILARLCAISQGHPHGAVQLAIDGGAKAPSAARRSAVQQRFSQQGCHGTRFSLVPSERAGDLVEVRWLAY